jgi:hypothetical protein
MAEPNLDIVALQDEAERSRSRYVRQRAHMRKFAMSSNVQIAEMMVDFAVEVVKRHCDGHGLERRPGAGME